MRSLRAALYRWLTTPDPLACLDCGLEYEDFPLDLVLSDEDWALIHPALQGVLCALCIVRRASRLPGVTCVAAELRRVSGSYGIPKATPPPARELTTGVQTGRGVPPTMTRLSDG